MELQKDAVLNNVVIDNWTLPRVSSFPDETSSLGGQVIFNDSTNTFYGYNGTAWVPFHGTTAPVNTHIWEYANSTLQPNIGASGATTDFLNFVAPLPLQSINDGGIGMMQTWQRNFRVGDLLARDWVTVPAINSTEMGSQNQSTGNGDVIASGRQNYILVDSSGRTILGGQTNTISDSLFATIGTGLNNQITNSVQGTIFQGQSNTLSGATNSVICNGLNQTINDSETAVIGNGQLNVINPGSTLSAIINGQSNIINGELNLIGSGLHNGMTSIQSVILNGLGNQIVTGQDAVSGYSFIGNGTTCVILVPVTSLDGRFNTIVGGTSIGLTSGGISTNYFRSNIILGGENVSLRNTTGDTQVCVFIGTGFENRVQNATFVGVAAGTSNAVVGAMYSGIGGGESNTINISGGDTTWSCILGGAQNLVSRNSSAIGGGGLNTVNIPQGVIGGGLSNTVSFSGSAVIGGQINLADSIDSFILGGSQNQTTNVITGPQYIFGGQNNVYGFIFGGANNQYSTVCSGSTNINQPSEPAIIFSGSDNSARNNGVCFGGQTNSAFLNINANGAVLGGQNCTLDTLGIDAGSALVQGVSHSVTDTFDVFVLGGNNNTTNGGTGVYILGGGGHSTGAAALNVTILAGTTTLVNNTNVLAWNGGDTADLSSTADSQVVFRAPNGYIIYSDGADTLGVSVSANGTSWSSISDRNRKNIIREMDGEETLDHLRNVPVYKYVYTGSSVEHIGPMAEDWHREFPCGLSEKFIDTINLDGVVLSAMKALYARIKG